MPVEEPVLRRIVDALQFTWANLTQLWLYVVAGVILAAFAMQLVPSKRIATSGALRGRSATFLAAVLGVVSPLCTYGTVPLLLQFCRSGGAIAPAIAFVVASSLANPQVLALTWGVLGPWMVVARVVSSIGIAMGAGALVWTVSARASLLHPEARCPDAHAAPHGHPGAEERRRFRWDRLLHDCLDLGGFIGLYFIIGLLIAGFVQVFVPRPWLQLVLGQRRWYNIVIATTLGMPLYACGGGSIPSVAVLIARGALDPGGALAFLTAGPALRIPCLLALAAFLSRRALLGYVLYVFLGTLVFGAVFSVLAQFFPAMVQVQPLTTPLPPW